LSIEQNDIVGKKVLVAGAGNIGRALCHVLGRNNDVDVLELRSRLSDPVLSDELARSCRTIWRRDLSHDSPLDGMPGDYDYVFNMAVHWGSGREMSFGDFDYFQRVNTLAAARLIFHCKDGGAKFVFGSTGGVYQPCPPGVARNERDVGIGGDNPYEITKIQMEWMTLGLSEMYGFPLAVLRYFWPIFPWGGGGPARGAIGTVLACNPVPRARTEEGKRPMNLGYVADLVYATIRAAAKAAPARLAEDHTACVYNVSGADVLSLEEIAREFAAQMGVEARFEDAEAEGQHLTYVADVSKMSRELRAPRIGARECIARVVRGIREKVTGPEDWMFETA
jgi:nucleoside-diphosphate-sugar epimerase